MMTFSSLSCSSAASLALHADQKDAHKMVPTAINHKNTSAISTTGRRGEYSCTDTAENLKIQVSHIKAKWGKHKSPRTEISHLRKYQMFWSNKKEIMSKISLLGNKLAVALWLWRTRKCLPFELFISILSKLAPASCGSMTAGMCIFRSVSSASQTILYNSAGKETISFTSE